MRVFLHAIWGQTLFNAYIAWMGYNTLRYRTKIRAYFLIFMSLEFLLYLTGFFFYKILPENILESIITVCNTWYIASVYITIGLLFPGLIKLSDKWWKWYPQWIRARLQQYEFWTFILIFFATLFLLITGYHNATYPVDRHVCIHIPKIVDGRDSLTVVLMCDLHLGERIRKEHVRRYVALCNAQNPDIVVIPGDVIDYETHFVVREQLEKELQQIESRLGTYITLGNHEYRADRNAKLKWLKETGATLLVDSVAMPDSTFYLIGRDDAINKRRSSLAALIQQVDLSKPVILLDHQPVHLNEVVMNLVDLSLHGHTHNGQIWPNTLALRIYYEHSYGYYRKGNTQFYVTSGIGFAGPPYRIGTRSELVVLHITFDKA